MGWEEREREHISVLNTSKKKEKYIPPGLGHSQLLSLSHSSTLAPAWLRILESSVLPFQGLLQTKLLGCGASPYPEHSMIRLKAQETCPLT